ncbi:hypothetical protein [Hymenobacter persicinus]|uniref:Uncharacterized protein n=1 Tax=Hymenobacter persicinus TaxID=2025506 RepID=A0A4V1ZAC6_9BACT|nr:hypothetical protein [Hymenobacter persicinus]RYU77194.1 hypothetical protein EWM57_17650 [Hymenobacter persicinus]
MKNNDMLTIKDSLARLEKMLYGYNYECHFQFKLLAKSADVALLLEIIARSPDNAGWSKPEIVDSISFEDFKANVMYGLDYRGDSGSGLALSVVQEEKLQKEVKHLWALLEQKFNPDSTEVFILPERYAWLFWGFCFLVVSKEASEAYFFEGVSSD